MIMGTQHFYISYKVASRKELNPELLGNDNIKCNACIEEGDSFFRSF